MQNNSILLHLVYIPVILFPLFILLVYDGLLLNFDLTQRKSFINLDDWLLKIYFRKHIPMVLIGNKSDLTMERAITQIEAIVT